jgi:hypothetical protein
MFGLAARATISRRALRTVSLLGKFTHLLIEVSSILQ